MEILLIIGVLVMILGGWLAWLELTSVIFAVGFICVIVAWIWKLVTEFKLMRNRQKNSFVFWLILIGGPLLLAAIIFGPTLFLLLDKNYY
jgi:hypothetical protein